MDIIPTIVGRGPLDWPQWLSCCWLQQMSCVLFKIYAGKHFFHHFPLPSNVMSCYIIFAIYQRWFLTIKSENKEVSLLHLNEILQETTLQLAPYEDKPNEPPLLLWLPKICTKPRVSLLTPSSYSRLRHSVSHSSEDPQDTARAWATAGKSWNQGVPHRKGIT